MKQHRTIRLLGTSIIGCLVVIWTANHYFATQLARAINASSSPFYGMQMDTTNARVKDESPRFPNFTDISSDTTWLVAEVTRGRLGNNMFQYGSAYGVFRDKQSDYPHLQFCVAPKKKPKFRDLTKFYQGPFAPVCAPSLQVTKELNETGYGTYTNFSIGCGSSPGCATVIREYLISFRYMDDIRPEMKHMYQLKGPAKKRQRDAMLRQFPRNATLVGIHVRRTDIARDRAFQSPPMSYYEQAMQYFLNKYDNVQFVIASDDKAWCAKQAVFSNATIIPDTYEPVIEMAVLSHCNHMILSLGTFGWWAAYLGGGEVLYWKGAFNMNHPKHKDLLTLEDYYPPKWIGLD